MKNHNMFSQNGPLTRTVEDSALLLEVMSGFDEKDPIKCKEIAEQICKKLLSNTVIENYKINIG